MAARDGLGQHFAADAQMLLALYRERDPVDGAPVLAYSEFRQALRDLGLNLRDDAQVRVQLDLGAGQEQQAWPGRFDVVLDFGENADPRYVGLVNVEEFDDGSAAGFDPEGDVLWLRESGSDRWLRREELEREEEEREQAPADDQPGDPWEGLEPWSPETAADSDEEGA